MYTYEEVYEKLRDFSNPTQLKVNAKQGVGENQFGCKMGDLRGLAKEIGLNNDLAFKLWKSENFDAMLFACMIADAKALSMDEILTMTRETTNVKILDEFTFNIVCDSPYVDEIQKILKSENSDLLGRVYWNVILIKVLSKKNYDYFNELLDIIEKNLKGMTNYTQAAANRVLCEIGIKYGDYTDRCIAIGESLGRLKEEKVPKGCTSSYAPEWIAAGIRLREGRKKKK